LYIFTPLYHPLIAFIYGINPYTSVQSGSDHSSYCGVHPLSVPPAGEYGDTFHASILLRRYCYLITDKMVKIYADYWEGCP
jgi:hypothetical protein